MKAECTVKIGYQLCDKCEYKLRCEECVNNQTGIDKIVEDTRKATARDILREFYDCRSYDAMRFTIRDKAREYGVEKEMYDE